MISIDKIKKTAYKFAKKLQEDETALLDNGMANDVKEWYLIVTIANAYYNYLLGKWTQSKAEEMIQHYIGVVEKQFCVFE